jgi:AcrR family transcriptional regulator
MVTMSAPVEVEPTESVRPNRNYDATLRRERAGGTRERIVAAGSELIHGGSVRDWKRLTVRAVAGRAGVSERTIYRHFGNERGLADAVMHRLEQEAGIDLDGMQLGDVAKVAAQIFEHVSSYPVDPRPLLDPTLVDANRRQKDALLSAVAATTRSWSADQRMWAAAMLDVLWSVASYERLVGDWQLDPDEAVRAVSWVISLVTQAVQEGREPV